MQPRKSWKTQIFVDICVLQLRSSSSCVALLEDKIFLDMSEAQPHQNCHRTADTTLYTTHADHECKNHNDDNECKKNHNKDIKRKKHADRILLVTLMVVVQLVVMSISSVLNGHPFVGALLFLILLATMSAVSGAKLSSHRPKWSTFFLVSCSVFAFVFACLVGVTTKQILEEQPPTSRSSKLTFVVCTAAAAISAFIIARSCWFILRRPTPSLPKTFECHPQPAPWVVDMSSTDHLINNSNDHLINNSNGHLIDNSNCHRQSMPLLYGTPTPPCRPKAASTSLVFPMRPSVYQSTTRHRSTSLPTKYSSSHRSICWPPQLQVHVKFANARRSHEPHFADPLLRRRTTSVLSRTSKIKKSSAACRASISRSVVTKSCRRSCDAQGRSLAKTILGCRPLNCVLV